VKLGRGFFGGYRRSQVDHLLEEITESFETVWRERADFGDRVELLEGELTRYRDLENLLRTTLVSAERAAHELKDQAKREAATIVSEAQAEARTITRKARTEYEMLSVEARRLRLLLHAALDALDEVENTELSEPEVRETKAA
jgi:cell division initiation protein